MVKYRCVGYGKTNSSGVATLNKNLDGSSMSHSYTGTGAGKIDFVASVIEPSEMSSSSSQSGTYSLIDATVMDRATSSSHTDTIWENGITGFTRGTDDTLVEITQQKYLLKYNIGDGIKFEFECTEHGSGVMQIARYETGKTTTYHNISFDVGVCSIECLPNVSYFKQDGEVILTVSNSPNGEARFFFNLYSGETTNFRYKNLRIYPI